MTRALAVLRLVATRVVTLPLVTLVVCASTVVNTPVLGVVLPIGVLSIVPPVMIALLVTIEYILPILPPNISTLAARKLVTLA